VTRLTRWLLPVAVLISACGTTVHSVPGGQAGSDGLATPSTKVQQTPQDSALAAGSGPEGVGGPAPFVSGTTPLAGSHPAPLTEGPSTTGAASGAAKPVNVGYTIFDQTGFTNYTGNDSLGSSASANNAADRREMTALVAWANATGGIGGRRLLPPVGIQTSPNDILDQSTMSAKCVEATEDHKVDVFIDRGSFYSDESVSCFARHKVTLVSLLGFNSQKLLQQSRPYAVTTVPSTERAAEAMVRGLHEAGYFNGATLGIVLDDLPGAELAYRTVISPRLKALGITPKEVIRVNASDASKASSEASGAVLKFRSAGVGHVFFFANLFAQLAFTQTAEAQQYRPRYAWGDYAADAPDAAYFVSPEQNANSMAVTSIPLYLVEKGKDKNPPVLASADIDRNDPALAPGTRHCLDVLSKYSGRDYYKAAAGRSSEWFLYCEHFLLWVESARHLGGRFAPAALDAGLRAVGSSYRPSLVHATDYSTGRFDGAASYRVGVYSTNPNCKCFVAVQPWRRY
jgi:hypothetical protein